MDRLTNESCAAMAALHNSSSADQRAFLVQNLRGYEADASALASQSTDAPAPEPSPTPL